MKEVAIVLAPIGSRAERRRRRPHAGDITVRSCMHDGSYSSAEMMSYIIFSIKQMRPAVHHALERLGLVYFDLYTNLRDIISAIAQK